MKAFSDAVKDGTQPMADAAKNALALSAAITGITSYLASQAYQSAVDYESAMSDLAKVLDGGMESAKTYGQQLNELALRYGQNGEQLLQAMANFKQAGFETNDAFRLVEESLKLMIAGDLDAAASSTQLVSILKGFKAPVSEAGHVVDALNEVSNRYATDVKKLAEGMAAISPIAKQMGFSIDETAGLLTPIIEVFQSGSEAADTLKTGLQRLTDQSDPVKDALASIGVSQLDLNGQLRAGKDIFLDVAKAMTSWTAPNNSTSLGSWSVLNKPDVWVRFSTIWPPISASRRPPQILRGRRLTRSTSGCKPPRRKMTGRRNPSGNLQQLSAPRLSHRLPA